MNGMQLAILLIYSGLSINIVLQCGLGIKGIAESRNPPGISALIKMGIIFFSVVLLWFFFSRIVYSAIHGIFIYVLLFPVSSVVYDLFEYLVFRYMYKEKPEAETFVSFPGGITAVCVFLCVNLSNGFLETAVLSFGFTAGVFLVYLVIREVRRRAVLEVVPSFLRGKPLVLITMGLLSLVFSVVSILLFRMAGAQ